MSTRPDPETSSKCGVYHGSAVEYYETTSRVPGATLVLTAYGLLLYAEEPDGGRSLSLVYNHKSSPRGYFIRAYQVPGSIIRRRNLTK